MKEALKVITLVVLALVSCIVINTNAQGMNYQACARNEDCLSKNCSGSRCAPLRCRNDKACLKAGLFDHYCRRRGPKIFASECVPKRG